MARIEPYRALRYDTTKVRAPDVLAPPYDVVGPAERARYAGRSAYNAIHLELPEPDVVGGLDRYEHAALLLSSWERSGVLLLDDEASLTFYRMTFTDELGVDRRTTGVVAALGIDSGRTGQVLPHEQTIPKDREDRLSLLRATGVNVSPIWGLSLAAGLGELCRAEVARAGASAFSARDDDGVLHEAWPVFDRDVAERLSALAARSPVLIADGHHRYETAAQFARERREDVGEREGPYDLVLAFVVELAEDELSVRAIHRLVSGVDPATLRAALAQWFEVSRGPGEVGELQRAMSAANALGLLCAEGSYLLAPRPKLYAVAEDGLDSSLAKAALLGAGPVTVTYQAGADEVLRAVTAGEADAAVLLRPVTVAQIASVADGGRKMEPKSTYFFPKPRTGITFRPLV